MTYVYLKRSDGTDALYNSEMIAMVDRNHKYPVLVLGQNALTDGKSGQGTFAINMGIDNVETAMMTLVAEINVAEKEAKLLDLRDRCFTNAFALKSKPSGSAPAV